MVGFLFLFFQVTVFLVKGKVVNTVHLKQEQVQRKMSIGDGCIYNTWGKKERGSKEEEKWEEK